jgi:hypothetical protein
MNPPKTLRRWKSRLIFGIVGAFFAMITIIAFDGGTIGTGRSKPEYISVTDEPVQFWLIVGASALISAAAFYCALAMGKR